MDGSLCMYVDRLYWSRVSQSGTRPHKTSFMPMVFAQETSCGEGVHCIINVQGFVFMVVSLSICFRDRLSDENPNK